MTIYDTCYKKMGWINLSTYGNKLCLSSSEVSGSKILTLLLCEV